MILVLTTYRTGSTNFCKDLAEQHKYENLDECFHENLPDLHKSVLRHLHKNKNCVVKLMPYHIEKSPINNLLSTCVYQDRFRATFYHKQIQDKIRQK